MTNQTPAPGGHGQHGGGSMDVKAIAAWGVVALILMLFYFGFKNGIGCSGLCAEAWRADIAAQGRSYRDPPPGNDGRWADMSDGPGPAVYRQQGMAYPPQGGMQRRPPQHGGMTGGGGRWGQVTDSNVCRPCPPGWFRRPVAEGPHGECNCSR